ncbi:CPBP family intramembrane glutamic endopeptidase [Pseudooceanicola sp. C21-150M6]|uniref:CPBP family intramembrane glutamic endopeptidase n=1 Tax=Pseudooceanicola sp. C21-150M6 TaxID=3434355 RepID=UPI003D7F66E8
MSYERHQILRDHAVPSKALWRLLCGLAIIAAGSIALNFVWAMGLHALIGAGIGPQTGARLNVLLALSSFLMILISLVAALAIVHRRGLGSLIGPSSDVLRDGARVMGVMILALAVALVWPSPEGLVPQLNMSVGTWLRWLPLALVLLVIQIATEELLFRGYLQSQLAARFRSPLIWLVVPAVVFALLHYNPAQPGNRWAVVGVTAVFALVAGDLTARTGNLGAAMAIHFANNFGSILLVGAAGPMAGLALYSVQVDAADPVMLPRYALEAGLIIVIWLAARLVLRR